MAPSSVHDRRIGLDTPSLSGPNLLFLTILLSPSCIAPARGCEERGYPSPIGLGVLAQGNHHPLRPSILPRLPKAVQPGRLRVALVESVGNTWSYIQGNYRADFGSLTTALEVGYDVDEHTLFEFQATDFARTDSDLDSVTELFHELFKIGDNDRDSFPKGDNVIDMVRRLDFEPVHDEHSGSVWRTYGAGVQREVLNSLDPMSTVHVGFDLRYIESTQGVLDDDDPWSVGFSIGAASLLRGDLHGYLGLGYAWHGAQQWYADRLHSTQFAWRAALEWHYAVHRSWVLQYAYADDVTVKRLPWHQPSHEVLLGWVWEGGHGTRFELGLLENVAVFGTSPDFGLQLGLRYGF